jgi:nucleoside-diphosphate-sugar epimerase
MSSAEQEINSSNKVIVTGANGFVGSAIVNFLENSGYLVIPVVRPGSNVSRIDAIKSNIEFCSEFMWSDLVERLKPDTVILADWAGVSAQSRNNPDQKLNIPRWVELSETCVKVGVGRLIALGSQAELGTSQIGATELSPFNPSTNYGFAKKEAFRKISMITKDGPTLFTWIRLFSVYGPLDNRNWVVPSVLRAIADKKSIELTACTQSWNFLHVRDLTRLIDVLISVKSPPLIIHAADTQSFELRKYLESLADLVDGRHYLKFGALDDPAKSAVQLLPDTTLASSLGWVPKVDWLSGCQELINNLGFTK